MAYKKIKNVRKKWSYENISCLYITEKTTFYMREAEKIHER